MSKEKTRKNGCGAERRRDFSPGGDRAGHEAAALRRGLFDHPQGGRGAARADAGARPESGQGVEGRRRRHDRRDRPQARHAARRGASPQGLPEAGVGLAVPEVPRGPHGLPGKHQDRDAQRLEGRSAGGLRGRTRDPQVGALQDDLHERVRPVRRPALRGARRQLRVRPRPAGHEAAPVRRQRRGDGARAVLLRP